MILLIFQVLAVVLLFLAAFEIPPLPRTSFGWLGLAIWFTCELLGSHLGRVGG